MERSLKDMEDARKSKEKAILRHFSLTKMLRATGIRRSPTAQCEVCEKVISSNKKLCMWCLTRQNEEGAINQRVATACAARVDAEVKAVPCEARVAT
jgi:hypothetical protein